MRDFPLACVGLLLAALSINGAPGDEHWDGHFGIPGLTEYILALRSDGTHLYAGGESPGISVTSTPLSIWSSGTWQSLGQGVSPTGASVAALDTHEGNLWVGGTFTEAGGKPSSYIARWNDEINFDLHPSIVLSQPGTIPGGLQFWITTEAVDQYVVEASSDFSAWFPLLTNDVSPYLFQDRPGQPLRVYRVHEQ